MGRGLLCVVFAMVAAACSSGTDAQPTTTSLPPTTQAAPPTTEASSSYPTEFPAEAVAELQTLEAGDDSSWTIDRAVAAVEILKPLLTSGVDAYPPIDISRLQWFLTENLDSMTDDQQAIVTASGPSSFTGGVLVAYQPESVDDVIRDAFATVAQDADSEFSRRTGSVLDNEIIIALSDLPLAGGAVLAGAITSKPENIRSFRWLFNSDAAFEVMKEEFDRATDGGKVEACVVVLGRTLYTSPDVTLQAMAMMHEVVHCHQHAAHPGGGAAFFAAPVNWMDEGYAAWAGEATVGGTLKSRGWWNLYHQGIGPVGGHVTNRGAYDGIAFFSYIHDNGVDGWNNFLDYFENIRPSGGSGPDQFDSIFSRLDEAARAGWAASSLQRSDLSELWTYTTGPGVNNSSEVRAPRQTDLNVGGATRFSLPNGEQGTYRIQPRLGGAAAALLRLDVSAPGMVRWPWGEDELGAGGISAIWCLGAECVCEDGTMLGTPAPEFTESDAILAAFTGAGVLTASLRTPEEECEDPDPDPDGFGACPSGNWEADVEETKDLLLTLYGAFGIDEVTYVSGSITMSFFESGTFRFDYVDTTFTAMLDDDTGVFVLTGGSLGDWEATATDLMVDITDIDVQISVSINGSPSAASQAPGGTGGGTADYVCAGDTLVIDPDFEQPFWPYPRTWTAVAATP